jgi:hypothetical protein
MDASGGGAAPAAGATLSATAAFDEILEAKDETLAATEKALAATKKALAVTEKALANTEELRAVDKATLARKDAELREAAGALQQKELQLAAARASAGRSRRAAAAAAAAAKGLVAQRTPDAAARAAAQAGRIMGLPRGRRLTRAEVAQLASSGAQLHRLLPSALRCDPSGGGDVRVEWLGDVLPPGTLDGLSAFLVIDGGGGGVDADAATRTVAHTYMRALTAGGVAGKRGCVRLPLDALPDTLSLVINDVALCGHGWAAASGAGTPAGPPSPASSGGSQSTPSAASAASPPPLAATPPSPAPGRSTSSRGTSARSVAEHAADDAHDGSACGCPLIVRVTITAAADGAQAAVIEFGVDAWKVRAGPEHLCHLAASADAEGGSGGPASEAGAGAASASEQQWDAHALGGGGDGTTSAFTAVPSRHAPLHVAVPTLNLRGLHLAALQW